MTVDKARDPIKIATAQSFVSADAHENGAEIRRLMYKAHSKGARLVHFTEGALSGYTKEQLGSWQTIAFTPIRRELEHICKLARQLNLWVIVGSAHELSPPNKPHNSLYIISNEGALHTRYDKQWLSHSEVKNWYTPGAASTLFEVDGWRFGCALCIEIQFPELFLSYLEADIDCLLFSTYSDSAMFGVQARGYAASCSYWLSFSVPVNTSGVCQGHMIGPNGDLMQGCLPEQSDLCLNTLDLQEERWNIALNYARPWRAIARQGDIYKTSNLDDPRSKHKTEF